MTGHVAQVCRGQVNCPLCAACGLPAGHWTGSAACPYKDKAAWEGSTPFFVKEEEGWGAGSYRGYGFRNGGGGFEGAWEVLGHQPPAETEEGWAKEQNLGPVKTVSVRPAARPKQP
jgi:hypothetical protein